MANARSGRRLEFAADETDLQFFLADAEEQLELLDRDLVRLEKAPDDETLQGIFRAAHTLKGSSATIGHTKMADLTHAMESVLDAVRKSALAITAPVIDALLDGLDALRVLRDEVATLEDSGMEFGALVARLHAILDGDAATDASTDTNVVTASGPSPDADAAADADTPAARTSAAGDAPGLITAEVQRAIDERIATGDAVHAVTVTLVDDCLMPAVRLFQCLVELRSMGAVLASNPSDAQIEQEETGRTLHAIHATPQDADAVRAALAPVLDLAQIDVAPLAPPEERGADSHAPDPEGAGRRVIDLGPEARGKSPEEQLRIAAQKMAAQAKSVRIDVARLDTLMNLSGELVIDRGRLSALSNRLSATPGVDPPLAEAFGEATAHLGRITTEIQDELMKSRMLPMENVVSRFPRVVRDLARKAEKEIEFEITGQETELDRSVIEEIGDPLIHLIRNAVDHGIEPPHEREQAGKPRAGHLHLSTAHEDNSIAIRIRDDGRGIDPDKIRQNAITKGVITEEAAARLSDADAIDLIWAPGFSTAATITNVSGRGVGMDIVKTNIQKLNGSVSVQSEVGVGTTFEVRVPLTLAVIQGLVLRAGRSVLVMPISSVTETLKVEPKAVKSVNGAPAIQLRGAVLPIVNLASLLGLSKEPTPDASATAVPTGQPASPTDGDLTGGNPASAETAGGEATRDDDRFVVAARLGDHQAGFVVDELLGEQEVVIKNLGAILRRTRGISGATLMGDEVALIADVSGLMQLHQERQRAA